MHGRDELLRRDEFAVEGDTAVLCHFQQDAVFVALSSGQVVSLGNIEIQYADLALELSVDDKEDEQDGQDIEHGHNRYALL